MSFAGKTAIVTGASSGLGVTFSEALAEAGANVVVAALRMERLEELAGRIEEGGGHALAVGCDVADPEQVAALTQAAVERFQSALWQTSSLLLVADDEAVVIDPCISSDEVARITGRASPAGGRLHRACRTS